jgi:hypothetical protein
MIPNFKVYNTKNVKWSYDKLKSYPAFQRNRDVLPRVKKLTKILATEYSPTQLEYRVGLAVKPFGKYKKGDMFVLDGNTRAEVYKRRADLIPPCDLDVKIYELDNLPDARTLYYSIDNSSAAEKSSEKVTGIHREREFDAISKVFKKGQYNTALKAACFYGKNEKGDYLQKASFETKLDFYWEAIQFLDSYNLNLYNRMSISVLASLLMIIKKHGVDNPRVDLLMRNFKGHTTVSNAEEMDGVHYVYNNLYSEYGSTWSQSSYGKAAEIISKILYGFELFVTDTTIKYRNDKLDLPNKQKMLEHYQFYIPRHYN